MIKSDLSNTKGRTKRRGAVVLCAFLAFAVFLVINIFRLDVFMHDYYSGKTFDQLTTSSVLRADRGNIYDKNMNLLATTSTGWRIFVSTREIQTKSKKNGKNYAEIIASGLSKILDMDSDALYKKISDTTQLDVTVKSIVDEEIFREVLSFAEQNRIEDLILTEAQSSRYYPCSTLAAHLLGFTGSDNQGLYGLEYSYNDILSGTDGYYLYAKDANGNAMPGNYISYVEAKDGASLVTTLDSYVQSELDGILAQIVAEQSVANRATGIVMDTKTGAILAMSTSSPFDPNSPFILDELSQKKLDNSGYAEGSEEYRALKNELMQIMWSNKAISETYEPGSTFKIITVASALDTGVADMHDSFSCPGYKMVGGWRIRCHKRTGHGSGFDLAYGLQMSCNPTMMTLAERLGSENFYKYVERFGYFEKTGIDLPSEAMSIFHDPNAFGTTEMATASFGQRFKVSIINHLTAIASIANGGYLVEPYIVDKIIDSNGNIISEHEVNVRRQVVSESVAESITKALEEGVSGDGGAKNAYVNGYFIAAKTGTSEKFDVLDANGNSYLRIASTVAYAPREEGGIAAIIVVDEPMAQVKYGSVVAAPYISQLFESILPYLDYQSNAESTTATVGNYVGMNTNSVTKLLASSGINYKLIGDGQVILAQSPAASIDINTNLSVVYLYTKKIEEERVTVPNLVGLNLSEANILAIDAGLNIRIIGNSDLSRGSILTVANQSIAAGTEVSRGSVIVLTALGLDFED